jgi:Domain of unknown function (DUF4388)
MEIRGQIPELNWIEILNLIEHARLGGNLRISAQGDRGRITQYQLWFDRGQIVAATPFNRQNFLTWLIHQNQWDFGNIEHLRGKCPRDQALGPYLLQNGLSSRQRQQLFQQQMQRVLREVSELTAGGLVFNSTIAPPPEEMTGLAMTWADFRHGSVVNCAPIG